MKKWNIIFTAIILSGILLSQVAFAKITTTIYAGLSTTEVTPNPLLLNGETDSLVPSENKKRIADFTWGIGTTYRWMLQNVNLLHDISLGLDLFHINTKQQGDVWQFQLPIFNNLTYTLPISSTRILLNSEWGFRPVFHYVFPFIEAGIGFAINEASYNDAPKPGTTAMPLHLNHHTQGQFSYSIGGGFRIPVRKNMEASLRFIYTDLGHAKTTNTGSITIAAPVSVALTTQTWVLGFTYLFQ